jgi:uncharacterized alkaline shock family protein YloU
MDTENSVQQAEAPAETGIVATTASTVPSEPVQVQDIDIADDSDSEDSLTFSNGVIEKIVAIAMRDVPGVVGMKGSWLNRVQDAFGASDTTKGVSVEVTPESAVKVNVSVLIEYGAYAPQVFEDVKKAVVKQVTGMTGLEVAGVNLRIEDVLTPEEYKRSVEAERGAEESAPVAGTDDADAATARGGKA